MTESANVRSLEAVREFRPALIAFAEDTRGALESLRTEVHRTHEWIDHDRPAFWREEARKSSDAVSEASSQLSRKQVIAAGSHRPHVTDEKLALDRAKKRANTAMEQQKSTRQWGMKLHLATDEYSTRVARLDHLLSHDVPHVVGLLERMIAALDSYASVARVPEASEDGDEPSESESKSAPNRPV